jgi:hypothetical protein
MTRRVISANDRVVSARLILLRLQESGDIERLAYILQDPSLCNRLIPRGDLSNHVRHINPLVISVAALLHGKRYLSVRRHPDLPAYPRIRAYERP